MAEFSVGGYTVRVPTTVMTGINSQVDLADIYRYLERVEAKKDEAFFANIVEPAGITRAEYEDAARRFVLAQKAVGALPALLIDNLLTSSLGHGDELPPGIGPDGRPIRQDAGQQTGTVGQQTGTPPTVPALAMWNADP